MRAWGPVWEHECGRPRRELGSGVARVTWHEWSRTARVEPGASLAWVECGSRARVGGAATYSPRPKALSPQR